MNINTECVNRNKGSDKTDTIHWVNPLIRIKRNSALLTTVLARCSLEDLPGVRIVLGNLARYPRVFRSRVRNDWYSFGCTQKFGCTFEEWIRCLDTLETFGVIRQVNGYRSSKSSQSGYMERGEWLSNVLESSDSSYIYGMTYVTKIPTPKNEVRIKDGGRPDFDVLHTIKESLRCVNDCTQSATWSIDSEGMKYWYAKDPERATLFRESYAKRPPHPQHNKHKRTSGLFVRFLPYYRIFDHADFVDHGRWYCGLWQQLPKEVRKYIRINGEVTVELDFSSTHLRILYNECGLEPESDLYTLPGPPHPQHNKHKRTSCSSSGFSLSREDWKKVATICIGAKSARTATEAIEARFTLALDDSRRINAPEGITGAMIRKQFLEFHKPVAHMLCRGQTPRLFGIESRIAARVLLGLAAQNVPCFALHDSFRVALKHEDTLRTLMLEAWKAELGFEPMVGRVIPPATLLSEPVEEPEARSVAPKRCKPSYRRTRAEMAQERAELERARQESQAWHDANDLSWSEAQTLIEMEMIYE